MDAFVAIAEPGTQTSWGYRVSTSIGDDIVANNPPLISCLMVTRGDVRLISSALHCFDLQTYRNKELVIIYYDKDSLVKDFIEKKRVPNVKLIYVEGRRSLGELRNISLREASGQIVCTWDDDDLYGTDRLQIQAGVLIKTQVSAVFLQRLLIWWPAKEILAISRRRPWENSIMAWKHRIPDYPHIAREEDKLMVAQLRKTNRFGLLDMPSLYCYVVHSNNTWNESHFAHIIRTSSHRLDYGDLGQISKILPFKEHICAQNILSKLEEPNAEPHSNVDNIIIKLNHNDISRLENCLCGSGKRYKHCHGSYRDPKIDLGYSQRTAPTAEA
jgi:glycosyltransferase involved in cell wall biosynthesis